MSSVPIVVIGAGAAGVAAASRLHEHGFGNVRILEAQGRTGGRVSSEKFGESHFLFCRRFKIFVRSVLRRNDGRCIFVG